MGYARARTGTEWLGRLGRWLGRHNVDVDLGSPDAVEILRRQAAEGVTIHGDGGATILFRDREPSISVVLEEVTHVVQAIKGRFAEEDARVMSCMREIEVREHLLERGERLGIPREEDDVSRRQLSDYRADLERLLEKWR